MNDPIAVVLSKGELELAIEALRATQAERDEVMAPTIRAIDALNLIQKFERALRPPLRAA